MGNANKAIERTRFPTPTVEDLTVKLRKAKKFSKLDLKSAFHQLELSPEYITAFQTENKVKQYTTLIFGVNRAAEELQNAIRMLLSDIEGAMNIADDILIFGENEHIHDKMLEKVFERLNEKGITLNFDKCICDKDNLEYYGLKFSKDGVKPSPHKIIALQNVRHPENAKAVRSFLELTNYFKKFIPNYSTIIIHTEL